MRASYWKRLSSLAVAAALATACDGPGSQGNVDVTMQQTDQMLAQVVGGWFGSVTSGSGSAAAISKDTVDKLVAQVTRIEFLPKAFEAQAANDGVWEALPLAPAAPLDLMALPTQNDSPIVIASGSVGAGSYGDVRLFVENLEIVFKGDIDLGVGFSFKGGITYQVFLPSGQETGIKTNAEFTVDAEGNTNAVHLLFSPDATFLNVTGTGEGQVILAPVIRSRP